MAYNRYPVPGPPGVNFLNPPYYGAMPPTFPIMGGPPGFQRPPMIPLQHMGPAPPSMPQQISGDVGYWSTGNRQGAVIDHVDRSSSRVYDGGSPTGHDISSFLHGVREDTSDSRRVLVLPRDRNYSPERKRERSYSPERKRERSYSPSRRRDRSYSPQRRRDSSYSPDRRRSPSRDRDYDGPSGTKRMRYDSDDKYERITPDRVETDVGRNLTDGLYDRNRSRRSVSPRRDDRNGYFSSQARRSPSRNSPSRRSPPRDSRNYASPSRQKYDRSPRRRSNDRSPRRMSRERSPRSLNRGRRGSFDIATSPGQRSMERSPGRRQYEKYEQISPPRRSPDQRLFESSPRRRSNERSPGRRSPGRRSFERSPRRRSPGRSFERSPRRRSPGRRSFERLPGRGSPGRRSFDRSPGRRSFESPPRRRSPGRNSPRRSFRRSPVNRSSDHYSPRRGSPDYGSSRHSRGRRDSPSGEFDARNYRRSPSPRDRKDDSRSSSPSNRNRTSDRLSPISDTKSDYGRNQPSQQTQNKAIWNCPKCIFPNHNSRIECLKCRFKGRPSIPGASNYLVMNYPPNCTQPGPEQLMKRIHVSNLDMNTSAEDLAHYFAKYGRVIYANIVMNKGTKRPKGFGFVSFSKESEATKAITTYHTIRGRAVIVNPLKFSEKIERKLETLYDEISSDEDEPTTVEDDKRFLCKVKLCGFTGFLIEFRHHWKEIHTSHGMFLVCPVCDTGCPDRTRMRRHLMLTHGVTDEGGTMDNILSNIKLQERPNPYYLDPGSVEKEGKEELTQGEPISPFKVIKCPESGCPFSATSVPLLKHWSNKHMPSSSLLVCPVCSVEFVTKALLIDHIKADHDVDVGGSSSSNAGGSGGGGPSMMEGAEDISSDEDDKPVYSGPPRFMCKVMGCKFQGVERSFKDHWIKRHEFMEKYLACPYCSVACTDNSNIRYHMINVHSVKRDDPILDDALIRSFTKEKINADYLDPGDVKPCEKFKIPNPKPKPSSSKATSKANVESFKSSEVKKEPPRVEERRKSEPKTVKKNIKTTATQTTEVKASSSASSSAPAFEMMKYNANSIESLKKFLAWTDGLMEKLEESHHEANRKLVALEEANQKKEATKKKVEEKKAVKSETKKESTKTVVKKAPVKKSVTPKTVRKIVTKAKQPVKAKPVSRSTKRTETRSRSSSGRDRYKK